MTTSMTVILDQLGIGELALAGEAWRSRRLECWLRITGNGQLVRSDDQETWAELKPHFTVSRRPARAYRKLRTHGLL